MAAGRLHRVENLICPLSFFPSVPRMPPPRLHLCTPGEPAMVPHRARPAQNRFMEKLGKKKGKSLIKAQRTQKTSGLIHKAKA